MNANFEAIVRSLVSRPLRDAILDGYMALNEGIGCNVDYLRNRIQSYDGNHWLPFNLKERCPECYENASEAAMAYETPESMLAKVYDCPASLSDSLNYFTLDDIIDIDTFRENLEMRDTDTIVSALNHDPSLLYRAAHCDRMMDSPAGTFDYNRTEVNQWLVHNTSKEHVPGILREGFKYGSDDDMLAYSGAGEASGIGNYLFAFPLEHAPAPTFSYRSHAPLRYGDCSIVFIGTGVNAYHNGDSEDQVIFDMDEPTSCFLVDREEMDDSQEYWRSVSERKKTLGRKLTKDELGEIEAYPATYWCVYGERNGRMAILYRCNEDEDNYAYRNCLDWISKNGMAYRKFMFHFPGRGRRKAQPGIMKRNI